MKKKESEGVWGSRENYEDRGWLEVVIISDKVKTMDVTREKCKKPIISTKTKP